MRTGWLFMNRLVLREGRLVVRECRLVVHGPVGCS